MAGGNPETPAGVRSGESGGTEKVEVQWLKMQRTFPSRSRGRTYWGGDSRNPDRRVCVSSVDNCVFAGVKNSY